MRRPAMRPGVVQCFYGVPERREPKDICYQWGGGGATKRHANALAFLVGFSGQRAEDVAAKFAEYGFDINTLRISVSVNRPTPADSTQATNPPYPSIRHG